MESETSEKQGKEDSLTQWDPMALLNSVDPSHVRYSRGFSRAEPNKWFSTLTSHWVPLFQAVGMQVELAGITRSFDFPEGLDRIVPVEVDGEPAVIGMDQVSCDTLAKGIVKGCSKPASEIVLEYMERRLLSSLTSSWSGNKEMLCHYVSSDKTADVDILGALCISLDVSGAPVSIWFGLGSALLSRLDLFWKDYVVNNISLEDISFNEDDLNYVSVELAELAVPPELLIDYMRSGVLIDLETPISDQVILRVNGSPWASGLLKKLNGKFAVEIVNLDPQEKQIPNDTTRVQLEVASLELDSRSIYEYSQAGAILSTPTPVSSTGSMSISGEIIARAIIGRLQESFAVNVMPK